MRLVPIFAVTAMIIFTGNAFASPAPTGSQYAGDGSSSGSYRSSSTHSGTAARVTGETLLAGGTAFGISAMFKGESDKSVKIAHAPEMSSSGSIGGLTLMIGGLLIASGRRRVRE